MAYLLRYKAWLLNKVRSKFGQPIAQVPSGKVTLTEMKNAEREILMSLQRKFFPKELKQLSKCDQSDRTKSVNKSSSISRLDPILKWFAACWRTTKTYHNSSGSKEPHYTAKEKPRF